MIMVVKWWNKKTDLMGSLLDREKYDPVEGVSDPDSKRPLISINTHERDEDDDQKAFHHPVTDSRGVDSCRLHTWSKQAKNCLFAFGV